jgi:hypothetical protein
MLKATSNFFTNFKYVIIGFMRSLPFNGIRE